MSNITCISYDFGTQHKLGEGDDEEDVDNCLEDKDDDNAAIW